MAKPYRDGELEVILSLVPTRENIKKLSRLLGRTEAALKMVYRIAYERGKFVEAARPQREKVLEAKKRLGIVVGQQRSKR